MREALSPYPSLWSAHVELVRGKQAAEDALRGIREMTSASGLASRLKGTFRKYLGADAQTTELAGAVHAAAEAGGRAAETAPVVDHARGRGCAPAEAAPSPAAEAAPQWRPARIDADGGTNAPARLWGRSHDADAALGSAYSTRGVSNNGDALVVGARVLYWSSEALAADRGGDAAGATPTPGIVRGVTLLPEGDFFEVELRGADGSSRIVNTVGSRLVGYTPPSQR